MMSGLFGPTTDAERRRVQRRKLAALADLLQRAAEADLPPIRWSLLPAGPVHGQCWDFDMSRRRTSFDDWADFLGAQRSAEWKAAGVTHLRAAATVAGAHGAAFVLTAELHDDYDECEGA